LVWVIVGALLLAGVVGVWLAGGFGLRNNTGGHEGVFATGPFELKLESTTALAQDDLWWVVVEGQVRNISDESVWIGELILEMAAPSSLSISQDGDTLLREADFQKPMWAGTFVGVLELEGRRHQIPPTGDWMYVRWVYQFPGTEPFRDFHRVVFAIVPLVWGDPSFLGMANVPMWLQIQDGTHQIVVMPLEFE
jgi:hypothetical protein